MRNFNDIITSLRQVLLGLSLGKRVALATFVALLAGALTFSSHVLRQDPMQPLYTDLQSEDLRNILRVLGEKNIPYEVSSDQKSVSTPKSMVATARMELAKKGLPEQATVGFEKFDHSTLGMSNYVQRIQYVRALQGELIRSIDRLDAVKSSRVHISIPPKKTFLEDDTPPKASVVIEMRNGKRLSKQEIAAISHLVASAVEGLTVSRVAILDTKGRFLHSPEDSNDAAVSAAMLDEERSLETDYEKRIEELLTPVVGYGKVRAKVAVQMDLSRKNSTEETYDADKSAVENVQKQDESSSGTRPNAGGVVGSRSNVPGQNGTATSPLPSTTTSTSRSTKNTRYAIPKKVQVVDVPSGGIKRLTVSVLVDGHYTEAPAVATPSGTKTPQSKTTPSAKPSFTPLSEDEMNRIKEIVQNAVGFDAERRDSITVTCLPFQNLETGEDGIEKHPWWEGSLGVVLKNSVLGLLFALFFFGMIRPFLKWFVTKETEKQLTVLPKTVDEIAIARQDQSIRALAKAANLFDVTQTIEKHETDDLKKRIEERLGQVPAKGGRIIQDWVDEDAAEEAEERSRRDKAVAGF